jgi:CPA1 family monovalent cation:H+ antiporter
LWRWRRIISSFAFVVVAFSALLVAVVAEAFIPGFSLALGFLLGGIVSPPDAVSAGAILKFVKVPRRVRSILEGESLLNDASSLIILRFALIGVTTGSFVWYEAAGSFVWMVAGGVGIGLGVGWLFMKLHKILPTDVNADIVISLVAPYVMYLAAEEAHSSGVLAVVSGGLLLSSRPHLFLSSASRLRGVNVWDSLVFVLNGLVFMLIGLDLPQITTGLEAEGVSIRAAIGYGVLITVVLIVGRIVAAYGAVITTLIARNFITGADAGNPGVKGPFLIGWTGMRGVVSLAAALSIPVQLDSGEAFPHRNLILFITFVVILLTLLIQGLTLPYFIRKFNLTDPDETHSEEVVEAYIRKGLSDEALAVLQNDYAEPLKTNRALQTMARRWEDSRGRADDFEMGDVSKTAYLAILHRQRKWLQDLNNRKQLLDEGVVKKHLRYLDIEEERLSYI